MEFTVGWEHVDEEKVKEAQEKYDAAWSTFCDLQDIWEELDKDEADEEDVEDAKDRMDDAEYEMDNAEYGLERAKESEWMEESITVEMWGSINDPQISCREVPGFDDLEPIFAVAAGLRSMCYKIYSRAGAQGRGDSMTFNVNEKIAELEMKMYELDGTRRLPSSRSTTN